MAHYALYLDSNINHVLAKHNCPNIVFRLVWQYSPFSVRPEIINLKYSIKEEIYKRTFLKPITIANGLYFHKYDKKRLNMLYKEHNSYENIVHYIRKITNDDDFRAAVFSEPVSTRTLKLGPYVRFRQNLINNGFL